MKKRERRKLTSEQHRIAISIVVHFRLGNMAEATASRFVSLDDTIESFIEEHENPNTVKKTKREVALLTVFLQTKGETRETAEIPPVELNELLSEFILSVRTKEGQEYEPSSLRGMVARKSYPISIINDLAFEKLRVTLQSKQKQLKKQGRGNKPNASVALTEDEIKLLFDKGLLGVSSPEAILNTLWLNNSLQFGLSRSKRAPRYALGRC